MRPFALLAALLLSPILPGETGPHTLTISPAEPDDTQSLILHVELTKPNSCYHVLHVLCGYADGEVLLTYDLADELTGVECLGEDLPENVWTGVGPLPAGEHRVLVREFRWSGGFLESVLELETTLTVTAGVPDRRHAWGVLKAFYR